MKPILVLTAFFLTASLNLKSQTTYFPYGIIDINNIRASVGANGHLFEDDTVNHYGFEVPIWSGKSTIFSSGIWIGGFDAAATLKLCVQSYNFGTSSTDFFPGPLTSSGVIDSSFNSQMNRVWVISKCAIDAYSNWIFTGMAGPNPVDPASMEVITNWPSVDAEGNPLAPFADYNGNGIYEPLLGEVPKILGDEAIYFVANDKGGIHTLSGGTGIGIQMEGMVYGYSCSSDSALFNTIFTNYKITNKSSFRLDSTYVGNFTDFDIGRFEDDNVGCNVKNGYYYGCNANSFDSIYGNNPPAEGVVFLSGPYTDSNGVDDAPVYWGNGTNYGDGTVDNEQLGMNRFTYFTNDADVSGYPIHPWDFYNYLSGAWLDSTLWTYGGDGHTATGPNCHFVFPGNSDPLGWGTNMSPQPDWDESSVDTIPEEIKGIGSSGPFSFQPGSSIHLDFAYVFAQEFNGSRSLNLLSSRIDSIKQKFGGPIAGCGCSPTANISEHKKNSNISIFPIPSNKFVTVKFQAETEHPQYKIYTSDGRLVDEGKSLGNNFRIDVSNWTPGLYLIQLLDQNTLLSTRFIVQ